VRRLHREERLEVLVESSPQRIIADARFAEAGATVVPDLADCPVIFGVKEIPAEKLEPGKTYIFFAHVIKGQPPNMPMLRRLMELGCHLIDYERITDEEGRRLVFFGRHAGLAGMINTLWMLGERWHRRGIDTPLRSIRQAHDFDCLEQARAVITDVADEIRSYGLPAPLCPVIIGVTGYGNVARGAQEILSLLPVHDIAPEEVPAVARRAGAGERTLYRVVFEERHLYEPADGVSAFALQDYYDHPERYRATFVRYWPHLTAVVNCIYWEEGYPRIVAKADLEHWYTGRERPRLEVIGDISCDVGGSIECNVRCTDPLNPVYVYEPARDSTVDGFVGDGPAVLAVDILPAELPADASREFSRILTPFVPAIARADFRVPFDDCALPPEIRRATIVYQGRLTGDYAYLQDTLSSQSVP
jgi:alpha-aminoadipic semialdehyde synthase